MAFGELHSAGKKGEVQTSTEDSEGNLNFKPAIAPHFQCVLSPVTITVVLYCLYESTEPHTDEYSNTLHSVQAV